MEFDDYLKKLRTDRKMTQAEFVQVTGETATTISYLERGLRSHHSKSAKRLVATLNQIDLLTENEIECLNRLANKPENNHHRIPNIPNFYQRLEKLCDEKGRICADKNPETFELLQIELGVRPSPSIFELLRQFRGTLSRRVFAKWLGVKESSYTSIERGGVRSNSRVLQSLLTSDCFTEEEQRRLRVAYIQLKEAEK